MFRAGHYRTATSMAGVAIFTIMSGALDLIAQKASPADLATKLTGTWSLNRELSSGFSAPGRGGPGGRRGGGPAFALGGGLGVQRRGGTGGSDTGPNTAADMTPEELAGIAALRQMQQIASDIKIAATPESVTFTDARGEQTFAINDKNANLEVGGAKLSTKSKWDKQTLRQEFSNTRSKLIRTWEIDDTNHLVMKAKVEGMSMVSNEVKAVFDRQP
jgi:hypothetical protein